MIPASHGMAQQIIVLPWWCNLVLSLWSSTRLEPGGSHHIHLQVRCNEVLGWLFAANVRACRGYLCVHKEPEECDIRHSSASFSAGYVAGSIITIKRHCSNPQTRAPQFNQDQAKDTEFFCCHPNCSNLSFYPAILSIQNFPDVLSHNQH